MIEKTTLARPYAKAIFNIALSTGRFKEWSNTLAVLASISKDTEVQRLLRDRTIPPEKLASFFEAIFPLTLSAQEKNLLHILAFKRRLSVLPEMETLYENLCNETENRLPVELESVIPLTETQKRDFTIFLGERFGKKIDLNNSINPDLIGGFWIKAGDKVIDGSIRGRLEQLKEIMSE